MIGVYFFLAVGLCLVALLLFWVRRNAVPFRDSRNGRKVEATLEVANLELPSWALAERIFSRKDLDFVSSQAPAFRQQFLRERKAAALLWLRDMRNIIGQVLEFHRTAVRGSVTLSPAVEIRLAVSYFAFLLIYEMAWTLIWLCGPFAARNVLAPVFRSAERVSLVTGRLLADLDPSLLTKIKDNWPGPSQAV